jgi:hypothetical protein
MDSPQIGGVKDMPEERAKGFKQRSFGNEILLNPGKYGVKYTLKGKEKVKDNDCFIMERSFPDGQTSTLYVDTSSYLAMKSKFKAPDETGKVVEAEIFYSDYKKVEGMMVAHSITIFRSGQEYARMTYEKVSFNTGLDDSLFKKPQPKPK